MPRPRLLHPVEVVIEPIDVAATVYRPNAREPIKTVARKTTVSVSAQVQWNKNRAPDAIRAGIAETASGYFIFLKSDLSDASYVPRHGDRVITIADTPQPISLYLKDQEPCGHYDGEYWMLRVDFVDKAPAR